MAIAAKKSDPLDKAVGSRLRALRLVKGLTQEGLANKLGITFQQIQKYEQGTDRISASRLIRIGEVLETPITSFFTHIGPGSVTSSGVAEDAEKFNHEEATLLKDGDIFQSKETINLLKIYYSIEDTQARNDLMNIMRTFAQNISQKK